MVGFCDRVNIILRLFDFHFFGSWSIRLLHVDSTLNSYLPSRSPISVVVAVWSPQGALRRDMEGVNPQWRIFQSFLKSLKIELPYDPTLLLLSIYLEKIKNCNLERYMHPNVYCSTVYNC